MNATSGEWTWSALAFWTGLTTLAMWLVATFVPGAAWPFFLGSALLLLGGLGISRSHRVVAVIGILIASACIVADLVDTRDRSHTAGVRVPTDGAEVP